MTYQDILVDAPAEHVLRITLNRPEARNALRTELLQELAEALGQADQDDSVRCVVLTGGDAVFAAGADVRQLVGKTKSDILASPRHSLWKQIQCFSKPLLAAVNGYCLGGGNELAMMGDIIIAAADAKFGQPEIKLGLIPGAGGTQRLTRAVGKATAMRLVLTGELMSAPEALRAGLVSEVVQPDQVQARALEIASAIAGMSPLAARAAKRSVNAAASENGLALERELYVGLFDSEDLQEGVAAFLEKRKPEFKGR